MPTKRLRDIYSMASLTNLTNEVQLPSLTVLILRHQGDEINTLGHYRGDLRDEGNQSR